MGNLVPGVEAVRVEGRGRLPARAEEGTGPASGRAWRYLLGSTLAVVALAWAVAVALQVAGGAYRNEFGGHSDEPGHYITGLMVRDYVAGLHWAHPARFADDYYHHYPKVALGHWPPVFYVVQAAWTLVFTPSRLSVLLLMAVLTAVWAGLLYRAVRADFGAGMGLAMALLLVLLPLVQQGTDLLMADTLTSLFCLGAVLCFGRFLDTGLWRSALAFGVVASLAILTKGSGLVLGLVPLLAVVLSRRFGVLRRPAFWCVPLVVAVLCGPWCVATLGLAHNGFDRPSPALAFTIPALGFYGLGLVRITGIGLSAVAVLGLFVKVIRPWWHGGAEGKWATAAALLIALLVFHGVVPVGFETRYLLPAAPLVLLFLAAGMAWLAERLPARWPAPGRLAAVGVAVAFVFAVETFTIPGQPWYGFGPVAQELIAKPDLRGATLLVSSDPRGEGAFIAEVAAHEERPGHTVLRGSKLLAKDDWMGHGYEPLYRTQEALTRRLEEAGVAVVVVDTSAPESPDLEHHRLLLEALESDPAHWRLTSSGRLVRDRTDCPDAVRVYRYLAATSR
ncbi:MAG TPA: glycosyltransferase family 39 protein [Gemmataceae bacterium]|nr:glycosyltransferase family 39 protein [Gemmataceae bacterium]